MTLDRSYEDECKLQRKKRLYEDLLSEEEILDIDIKIVKQRKLINTKKGILNIMENNIIDPNNSHCSLCLTKLAEYALVPCGHKCYCEECVQKINRCSICRQIVDGSIKVYSV